MILGFAFAATLLLIWRLDGLRASFASLGDQSRDQSTNQHHGEGQ